LDSALNEVKEALQMIHDTGEFIALHVNPYIPHVFVDEKTHVYTGIIDFGDSYIGHPIFDMWYWKVESRKMLLKGYTSEKPVNAAFERIFDTINDISGIVNKWII
jgi:aminoglycoside phosphotransferase (APT) family kinase protein